MTISRRTAMKATLGAAFVSQLRATERPATPAEDLKGEIGITTGSFMKHITFKPQKGKQRMLDLPVMMRDELDMRVIDLMTRTLESFEPAYIDELRTRAEKAGCIITNLKMNQRGLDMASPDKATRVKAMTEYRRTIDVAQRLGCRWVRPLPGSGRPDLNRLADSYKELIDYAAPKGISLLIENNGWISNNPNAIPSVLAKVPQGLDAAPDTGNWTNEVRFEGLKKAFPHAVTCDFKAYQLGPNGEHPRYDIKRCFRVAWDAGYRGPWCLEHFNESLDGLLKGFAQLRDWIKQWTKEAS